MAKAAAKPKSAMDALVHSFSDLVEEARERMSPQEFRQAEKEFDEIINKAEACSCIYCNSAGVSILAAVLLKTS